MAPPEEKPDSAKSSKPWRRRNSVSAASSSRTSSRVCRSFAWSPEEPCMPGRPIRNTGTPGMAPASTSAARRRDSGVCS